MLIDTVKKEARELIKPGDTVVAAFSGGADSTALVAALSSLRDELGFSLVAAHYNHSIRKNADGDEEFSRDTAARLGVPFVSEKGDVPAFAEKNGLSLETAARLLRYGFLYRVKEKYGAASVATAHHAGDDAESILLHLFRGSGMAGLTGIRKKSVIDLSLHSGVPGLEGEGEKKLVLIRPLLSLSKEELAAFLRETGLSHCEDETNFASDAARNYLRLEILPRIRENVNPAVEKNLVRMAEIIAEDEEYLYSAAREALEKARAGEPDKGYSAAALAALPAPIKKRCLRLALSECASLVDVEKKHLDALTELIGMQSGAALDLPHSRARISFGRLVIEKAFPSEKEEDAGENAGNAEEEYPLPLENGEYATPLGTFSVTLLSAEEAAGADLRADRNTAYMDMDALGGKSLAVRRRRPGDRFRPINCEWRVKLKDFLISRRVDEKLRDALPLVVCGGEIVFIPGVTVSETAKITENTVRAVRIVRIG